MTSHAAMLAAARRARRRPAAAPILDTLESRPPQVTRTIDAAVNAAIKVLVSAGMAPYVADGAPDVAAALYRRVILGADVEQARRRERDAADLETILS